MIRVLLIILLLLPGSLLAVQPDEILADPVMEERAREISKGLRCPVCQNESIDESHANIARDLRLLVRDRLVEGDSDAEVVDFVVARYGEFVLLKPTIGGSNWMLWAAGPFMLLLAMTVGFFYLRGRDSARAPQEDALSVDEAARLKEILKE
ncbi:cytochrome c-type biogenesis protein [Roseobacter litoralis]|uniref:Cytochrome c-type biogenesis protein n=1 Tax=Roseobacter litoralis (strain ATCC 49566 / DSM 6996 / JCM 21268 / NBRC 15278 / OCh 149) TaxID=391595 RepID=F7ZC24_ROSLO|nr:cytochrome c-type biogenesis protein [Roseobacter litoralis]AEI94410.1 cytochrome c-type biogenesis protein CcmH [Roseobacter litoralis Och 149]